jgi:hypothetical protein
MVFCHAEPFATCHSEPKAKNLILLRVNSAKHPILTMLIAVAFFIRQLADWRIQNDILS